MNKPGYPLRLKPWSFEGVVPASGGFVASMAAQSWQGRLAGGNDRYWWPLLWTLPCAAQHWGVGPAPLAAGTPTDTEADYRDDPLSVVVSGPAFGRGLAPLRRPRAILFRADAPGYLYAGMRDALLALADRLLPAGIFCALDPTVNAAPVPFCCGLTPSGYVRVADPVPHSSGTSLPFPEVEPEKWSGGDLLFLHLVDQSEVAFSVGWLYYDPSLGSSGDWTGGYVALPNARARAEATFPQIAGVFDRFKYWVGYIDGADAVVTNQAGDNVLAGGNDFYRAGYVEVAAAVGATLEVFPMGSGADDIGHAVTRQVQQFYGIGG